MESLYKNKADCYTKTHSQYDCNLIAFIDMCWSACEAQRYPNFMHSAQPQSHGSRHVLMVVLMFVVPPEFALQQLREQSPRSCCAYTFCSQQSLYHAIHMLSLSFSYVLNYNLRSRMTHLYE